MNPLDIKTAIEDAIDIVAKASIACSNGPHQPWRFLQHVRDYLSSQATSEFESVWAELIKE